MQKQSTKVLTVAQPQHVACTPYRDLHRTALLRCDAEEGDEEEEEGEGEAGQPKVVDVLDGKRLVVKSRKVLDIPWQTSVQYMKSAAYKQTYGEQPVWVPYKRNFKGQYTPRRTRKCCIKHGLTFGNACPVCRDDYLVLHFRNTALLQQFISPYTGNLLSQYKTNVCDTAQLHLKINIDKAQDFGLLPCDVPLRQYDYSLYYPGWQEAQ